MNAHLRCVACWFAAAVAAASFDVGQARAQRAAVPVAHTVELAQTKLTFLAGVSRIPIKDKDGRVDAEAGIVSFLRDGGDAAPRPVTFVVGGGPGTSSAYLNLGALGPWRIRFRRRAVDAASFSAEHRNLARFHRSRIRRSARASGRGVCCRRFQSDERAACGRSIGRRQRARRRDRRLAARQ